MTFRSLYLVTLSSVVPSFIPLSSRLELPRPVHHASSNLRKQVLCPNWPCKRSLRSPQHSPRPHARLQLFLLSWVPNSPIQFLDYLCTIHLSWMKRPHRLFLPSASNGSRNGITFHPTNQARKLGVILDNFFSFTLQHPAPWRSHRQGMSILPLTNCISLP